MNYETQLINAIIDSGDLQTCVDRNVGKVFTDHRDVWEFILEFNSKYGTTPSKDALKGKFSDFEFITTKSPLNYYIDEAESKSMGQRVRSTLLKATEGLKKGDDPQQILNLLATQSTEIMRESGRLKDIDVTDWKERAEILRERVNNPDDHVLGIPSGISTIDTHFGGWQPGDFVVVMGWTGAGKSFLTRLFAVNAWKQGYTPLIISLEMDKTQELYRMDTILNAGKVFKNSQLSHGKNILPEDYEAWAANEFNDTHPFHLITSDGVEVADQFFVQAKIEQYKPDLVILDYHTLFDDARKGGTETERAKNLSKDFKRIAVRNRVPVIDVSGVTMENGHAERPPELNEIAWSKQLVYDSDMVLAQHRVPDSNNFQVITRKTRRCPPFAFYLDWDLDTGKWQEMFDGDFL